MYISIQGVFRKQKTQEHSHLFTYSVCGHFSVVDTRGLWIQYNIKEILTILKQCKKISVHMFKHNDTTVQTQKDW